MTKIEPSIKFSYNLIKGSVESRRKFASELNNKMFNSLLPVFKERKVDINHLDKVYSTLLPEPKYVKIKGLDYANRDIFCGQSGYIEENGITKGLTIELLTKKSKVSNIDFVTFMHENTHVLDTLTNPKHTARAISLNYADNRFIPINDWYDNVMYHEEKFNNLHAKKQIIKNIHRQTEKTLKDFSRLEKINILQDTRYTLEQEYNAYEEQVKYAKKLSKMKRPINNSDLKNYSPKYMFKEKISILKKTIYKLIQEERIEHKKLIKNQIEKNCLH